MPKTYNCWRSGMLIPMLTDSEWEEVEPLLGITGRKITEYREANGGSFIEAIENLRSLAADKYFEITGFQVSNPLKIWNYRLANYGAECLECGNLLRTPRASYCVKCGKKV